MSGTWALSAPRESLPAIARLRQVPGLAICEEGQRLWLRGPDLDDSLAAALKQYVAVWVGRPPDLPAQLVTLRLP